MTMCKKEWAVHPDRKKHTYVIGIDFGHEETSAAFCPIEWDKPARELSFVQDLYLGRGSNKILSAISIDVDGRAYIGEAAFSAVISKNASFQVCFKKKPENIDGEQEQLMIRFMHEVYILIRENNEALFLDGNHIVFIATPSGWDENAKDLYGQMAAKAGLPIAGVMSESRAAFVKAQQYVISGLPQYFGKGAVVADMGSSTFDFTYFGEGMSKPIDFGYNCGASEVERIMYKDAKGEREDIASFEEKYPNLIAHLLFETRCIKEQYYEQPDFGIERTINFDNFVNDKQFKNTRMRFEYKPGALNKKLKDAGYMKQIADDLDDFKDKHIPGRSIYTVFLTGWASRMDFIKELVKDRWNLPDEMVFRDNYPLSERVAEVARADVRLGEIDFDRILRDAEACDLYTDFKDSLTNKITDKIMLAIAQSVKVFKENEEDCSLSGLKLIIKNNIGEDIKHIPEWTKECYTTVFANKTKELRDKLNRIVSNYTGEILGHGEPNISAVSFMEFDTDLYKNATRVILGISGKDIPGVIVELLNLLVSGVSPWAFYLIPPISETEIEAAMSKNLGKRKRKKVFNKFDEQLGDIRYKVRSLIELVIDESKELKDSIEVGRKRFKQYARDCSRLMIEN